MGKGRWVDNPFGLASLQVNAAAVKTVTNTDAANTVAGVLSLTQRLRHFWTEITFIPTAPEANSKFLELIVGDPATNDADLQIIWGTSNPGPGLIHCDYGSAITGQQHFSGAVANFNVPKVIACAFRPLEQEIDLIWDGVVVQTVLITDLSNLTPPDLQLVSSMQAVAATPTITRVRVGTGSYPPT